MMDAAGASVPRKQWIDVSPEMASFVGEGAIDVRHWPPSPIAIGFDPGDAGRPATFHLHVVPAETLDDRHPLVLVVSGGACHRIFGFVPDADVAFHLPAEMRGIVHTIRDCALPEPARGTLRLAKSIELLCAAFAGIADDSLVPLDGHGVFSELDTQRIVAARRLIEERGHEKLTLDSIARACGLNRAKLTRGFRAMFACTVADALTRQRLGKARQMLVATDLPVSSIGYACGYLNNASFTRAFSRAYGMTPSSVRAPRLAA